MVNDGINNGINNGITGWWFGAFGLFFNWEFHNPNWRSHIFRGVGLNHQAVYFAIAWMCCFLWIAKSLARENPPRLHSAWMKSQCFMVFHAPYVYYRLFILVFVFMFSDVLWYHKLVHFRIFIQAIPMLEDPGSPRNLFYFDSSYRPIPLETSFLGITESLELDESLPTKNWNPPNP